MQLRAGQVAVVTGAASGIGRALADRFASRGLRVVLADVDEAALDEAAAAVAALGVETLGVVTDVSDAAAVDALAAAVLERFGAAHVVCNNAGVATTGDPWFGPISGWQWVIGVNLWGVIHGVRAFLPTLVGQGEGHIVNTASIAGLVPGFGPSYDASKHAVVAVTEDLYRQLQLIGLPVGVSVLCPGWVRTGIMDADRNWPDELGERPAPAIGFDVLAEHVRRAVDEGAQPSYVADLVAAAIESDSFWVFPHPEFVELAVRRWHGIAEGLNPEPLGDIPGLPTQEQLQQELTDRLSPPAS
jgi:NAD(P)-dependent dehydrogenase (short-subunit alcohol dehydrogenase family)